MKIGGKYEDLVSSYRSIMTWYLSLWCSSILVRRRALSLNLFTVRFAAATYAEILVVVSQKHIKNLYFKCPLFSLARKRHTFWDN